jgi:hypothetical protein
MRVTHREATCDTVADMSLPDRIDIGVLLGLDDPLLTPDRWLADLEALEITPEMRPLIPKESGVRLPGLDEAGRA